MSDLAVACPQCGRPIASPLAAESRERERERGREEGEDVDTPKPATRRGLPRPEAPAALAKNRADLRSGRCAVCREMILGAASDDGEFVCHDCQEREIAHAQLRRTFVRRVIVGIVVALLLAGLGIGALQLLSLRAKHDAVAPHS